MREFGSRFAAYFASSVSHAGSQVGTARFGRCMGMGNVEQGLPKCDVDGNTESERGPVWIGNRLTNRSSRYDVPTLVVETNRSRSDRNTFNMCNCSAARFPALHGPFDTCSTASPVSFHRFLRAFTAAIRRKFERPDLAPRYHAYFEGMLQNHPRHRIAHTDDSEMRRLHLTRTDTMTSDHTTPS